MSYTTRHRHAGFTLVELMIATVAIAVLAAIALSTYRNYRDKLNNGLAGNDLVVIQTAISQYAVEHGALPNALSDVGTAVASMKDPWGVAYQYVNHANTPPGHWRKDKNIVPINTDYDLYSKGRDGASTGPLTAQSSRDDILRANNGRFIGLASVYDP